LALKKSIIKILAFTPVFVLLCSCSNIYNREYYIEQDYNAGYVETIPDSDIQEVRNYSGLRDAIETLVLNFSEEGTIRLLNYPGDAEDDSSRAINYVTRETPLGVYAVDYIRQDMHTYLTNYELSVKIYYKIPHAELELIPRYVTLKEMYTSIENVLFNFGRRLIFQIDASRLTERQISEFIENYRETYPETLTELPEILITAYPNWNSIRKIILLELKYSKSSESLLAERMLNNWYAQKSE